MEVKKHDNKTAIMFLYSSWFLYSESLDHLEHIHYTLCLTPLNSSSYSTEHTRPTHCITVYIEREKTVLTYDNRNHGEIEPAMY